MEIFTLIGIFLLVLVGAYGTLSYIGRRMRGQKREYNVNLSGKVVVITGCSAGVGKEAARVIAGTGATIIFACRDESKTRPIMSQISQQTKNDNLVFMKLNLSDLESVRQFSDEFHKRYTRLDILLNNAGIGNTNVILDSQGHDLVFKTNHVGHFLLTNLLLDLVISTKESRVVTLSSYVHQKVNSALSFDDVLKGRSDMMFSGYVGSKYGNILMSEELQNKFNEKNINSKSVALHPGYVASEIWGKAHRSKISAFLVELFLKFTKPLMINEEEGAWTSIYCSLMPYNELVGGAYYQYNKLSRCSKCVKRLNQHKDWWVKTEEVVGIKSII